RHRVLHVRRRRDPRAVELAVPEQASAPARSGPARRRDEPRAVLNYPAPMTLKGKTLFITGASRGIGLAIGLRAARDGANVAIAAKTAEPNPKLPGTIFTAAKDIDDAGGKGLALQCDIRFEEQVQAAVAKTVETFGGI